MGAGVLPEVQAVPVVAVLPHGDQGGDAHGLGPGEEGDLRGELVGEVHRPGEGLALNLLLSQGPGGEEAEASPKKGPAGNGTGHLIHHRGSAHGYLLIPARPYHAPV